MRTPSPRLRIVQTSTSRWQTRPACNPSNAKLFHPLSYTDPAGQPHPEVKEAKAICARCPLLTSCRDDILEREGTKAPEARHGIQGGLTPQERADLAGVTTGRNNRRRAAA